MKLLFICSRHPYPPEKGDQLIAYEQIKRLAEKHQVYLVCFEPPRVSGEMATFESSLAEVFYLKHSRSGGLFGALKSIYNGKPVQVNMYNSSKNLKMVQEIAEQVKPDRILVQTIRMAEFAKGLPCRKILDMIDLMSLNMLRRAEREPSLIAWFLRWESWLLKRYEKQMHEEYDGIVLVSGDDARIMDLPNVSVNPNGTYITRERITELIPIEKENMVLFQGNMSYYPNVEAAISFARDIWPELHRRWPYYRFVIAGRNPHKSIKKLEKEAGIFVLGEVEDMISLLLKARIGVYLMHSGTGMQNKILEALACDLPVITSEIGAAGLGPELRDELYVPEGNAAILDMIDKLLQSSEKGELGVHPERNLVLNSYSWERNVMRLESILKVTGEGIQ